MGWVRPQADRRSLQNYRAVQNFQSPPLVGLGGRSIEVKSRILRLTAGLGPWAWPVGGTRLALVGATRSRNAVLGGVRCQHTARWQRPTHQHNT